MGQIIASELMYFAYYFLFYDLNLVYFLSIISHYMQSTVLFCQVPCKFLTKLRSSELSCLSLWCSHLSNSSAFFRTLFEYHLLRQALPKLSIIQPSPPFPLGCHSTLSRPPLPYLMCGITLFCLLSALSCDSLEARSAFLVLFLFFNASRSLYRV